MSDLLHLVRRPKCSRLLENNLKAFQSKEEPCFELNSLAGFKRYGARASYCILPRKPVGTFNLVGIHGRRLVGIRCYTRISLGGVSWKGSGLDRISKLMSARVLLRALIITQGR